MKTYIDHGDTLQLEDLFIPKSRENRHYQEFLEEEKKNEVKIVPYQKPPLKWDDIRPRRNNLLAASDWTQLPDAALTEEHRVNWKNYRQKLRDLPESFSKPEDLVWPKTPNNDR